jgi:hypothetical protein
VVLWLIGGGGRRERLPVIPGEHDTTAVEVLNATRIDGLARHMTLRLRRAGIDVVHFGTATESSLDSTLILIRRGDSIPGTRVRDVIGGGRIVMDPEPGLLLDVSVLLGHDVARASGIAP